MNVIQNESVLNNELKALDLKIRKINEEKIVTLFNHLGLSERNDIPQNYLEWDNILIVVPSRTVSHELKQFRYSIDRISFVTNINARQIYIYNLSDWKNAIQNKTQLQIRNMLKQSFGGEARFHETFRKE